MNMFNLATWMLLNRWDFLMEFPNLNECFFIQIFVGLLN